MENIEKEYKEISEKRKQVLTELLELEENEQVKRYLELVDQNEELEEKEKKTYAKMKAKNYKECHHLTIYTKVYDDALEGRRYRNVGCIKCGADTEVLDVSTIFLTEVEKAMYDYLKSYSNLFFNSKPTVICDLSLATAIYQKIKEKNPGINDMQAKKYFEIALDNIRNIKVTEQRTQSRAKRLGLKPNFNKWRKEDVIED